MIDFALDSRIFLNNELFGYFSRNYIESTLLLINSICFV